MSDTHETQAILIVEDEERLRKALERSLRQENCETLTAASAEEALGLLKERKIDLVITDLVMPGMDGMALVRSIKETFPQMKMIIITAYGSAESMEEAEELEVACYLAKPFDLSHLKSTVNELLLAGETSASSGPGSPCRGKDQGARCFWSVGGKALGTIGRSLRRAFPRIKPSRVVFVLGRAVRAASRLAAVFKKRR